MRAILVGYGHRGRALLPAIRAIAGLELAGIADVSPEARARAINETRLPVFSPFDAEWPITPPELLILATPADGRVELIEAVARDGVRGILAEKPLAFTVGEVDRLLQVCRQAQIALGVFQHWRACPELQTLKGMMASGELGTIQSIHGLCYGNLLDQGWHLLDAARWLQGGPEVDWAQASGSNDRERLVCLVDDDVPVDFDPQHPAPIWTQAELGLDNGVRVKLDCGPLVTRTNAPLGLWHERRLQIVGSAGTAEVRPGHYLKTVSPATGAREWSFDPGSLDVATRRVIEDFCAAIRSGGPVSSSAEDARCTVAGLVLCGNSLRSGSVARRPAVPTDDPFRSPASAPQSVRCDHTPSPTGPEYSILIPLSCHREHLQLCLKGWLNQTGVAPDEFELLYLDETTGHPVLPLLRPQLRPQDRVIRELGGNRSRLYDLGARVARGRYVVFTESHCRPEPDFLRELTSYLQSQPVAGACCRTIPVTPCALARADAAVHMAGFAELHREDDWRKFIIHGVALLREAYLAVGGLQSQYDLFAEMVLAADLRDAGFRFGYAPAAAVHHLYRSSVFELQEELSYTQGEMTYRREHGTVARIGYSYLEMCGDVLDSNVARRRALRTEWTRLTPQLVRGNFTAWAAIAKTAYNVLRNGRCGGLWSRLEWWSAATRCWLFRFSDQAMATAFRDLLLASYRVAWHRYRHIGSIAPGRDLTTGLTADQLDAESSYGFHAIERFQGRRFRWTRPVAGIELPRTPGRYCVELDVGVIRPWPFAIDWTLNGETIDNRQVDIDGEVCRLTISLPEASAGRGNILGIACAPWDAPDERQLGLPVFTVRCRPIEEVLDEEPTILTIPNAANRQVLVARAA